MHTLKERGPSSKSSWDLRSIDELASSRTSSHLKKELKLSATLRRSRTRLPNATSKLKKRRTG